MANDTSEVLSRCYLFNNATPDVWGNCCDDLSIVPKPVWVVFLLSVPIEAVLAGADVRATAGMYEEKSNQTAVIFLLYNFVTLGLLAYQFDWGSCEASVEGVWECYQGLLFMFYNSTAALASMTLWMLIIMRKYYPQLYFVTRLVISPRFLWRWFDRLNLKNGGTHATVERWNMISTSTKLFWYNKVGIVTTLLFGGITHIIPMFFAYPYILVSMCIALVYSHSLRLGYTGLKNTTNLWSTIWNVLTFYPFSLVISAVFLALSPLSAMLKLCGCHSMDRKDDSLPMVNPEDANMMEIFFKTEGGGLITLEFDKEESVVAVLPKVQDNLGFDFIKRTIHIKFNGEQLEESETVTLAEYGIKSGDVLEILVDPEKIEIRVRLENGDTLVIKIDPQAPVDLLMSELAKQTGIPPNGQYLLQDGERLQGGVNLISLGLTDEKELELFALEIELQITLSTGDIKTVTLSRDFLGDALIATVASLESTTKEYIHLSFNGNDLDPFEKLHNQGLTTDSQLTTVREVDVYINHVDGKRITLRLDINTTITELSERLVKESQIQVEDQYLIHQGERPEEENTLRDFEQLEFELSNINFYLSVALSNGQARKLTLRRDDSVAKLRGNIASIEGVKEELVHVYFNDEELLDDTKSLHEVGMRDTGNLQTVQARVDIEVEVTLPGSKRFRAVVDSKATVLDLKKKWHEESNIDPSEQLLLVNGQLVDDSEGIEEVASEGELRLTQREVTLRLVAEAGGIAVDLPIRLDATFGELLERVAPLRGYGRLHRDLELFFPRLDVGTEGQATRVPDNNVPLYELGVEDGEEVVALYPRLQESGLVTNDSAAYVPVYPREEERKATKISKRPKREREAKKLPGASLAPKSGKKKKKIERRSQIPAKPQKSWEKPIAVKSKDSKFSALRSLASESRQLAKTGFLDGDMEGKTTGKKVAPQVQKEEEAPRFQLLAPPELEVTGAIVEETAEERAAEIKEERRERRRERRRRVLAYVKDILRNLCMFDPNGKVIMFAAATTFLCFTFSANYGLILYSGAPYLKVLELDWNSRDSLQWFQCTADNFADFRAFGLIDFLGLAIGTAAGLIEFADFLVSI